MDEAAETEPGDRRSDLVGAGLDELLREVLGRVDEVLDDQRRLRLLLDAVVTIAADLSLDSVLERIVEVAADLVEARYVALGVLDSGPERRLRAFVTHGLSGAERDAIGPLPTGHGLLGLIIDQPEALRLDDLGAHPTSFGFPAHHPPMHSLLGVPVRIGDRVFGNLYLTEKLGGGPFTEQDEAIVVALAAAAGVVVENARLYEEAARRERWLQATADLTRLIVGGVDADDALQAIVDTAKEVADADVAAITLRSHAERLAVEVVAGAAAPPDPVDDSSLVGHVIDSGETVVTDVRDDSRAAPTPQGWPTLGPVVVVPMTASGSVRGALSLAWRPDRVSVFRELDRPMVESFVEQLGLALSVARSREDQQRLVVFEDRDRIGRDLHDLVIQRLFAVGLTLENTARMASQPEIKHRVGGAVDDIDATIKEIRRSIFALSTVDDSTDLRSAVADVVARAGKVLGFRPMLGLEGPVNSAVSDEIAPHLLAVLGEALTNVSRHAEATSAQVSVSVLGPDVVLTVRDDGKGLEPGRQEGGMRNMRERAERLSGRLVLDSEPGRGTTLTWSVPRL